MLSVPTFGAASFAGAAVAGATLVAKVVDKYYKPDEVKLTQEAFDMADKEKVSACLNAIIKDVAKELSRIFESQIFELENDKQVEMLAQCAVALMLNLKKNDTFDRNTLIKKILHDGKLGRKKLCTRDDINLFAPNVFRKPGLRKITFERDSARVEYFVKSDNSSKTRKYGFRGEFLELVEYSDKKEGYFGGLFKYCWGKMCKECACDSDFGLHFVQSNFDSEYTKPAPLQQHQYLPIHVLIQCPKVLDNFKQSNEKKSLANFLKTKLGLPESSIVRPVYRSHSPSKVTDLQNSNLEGSDFSHSDFTDSSLEKCKFYKCVMLFATFTRAKMSGSSFCDTLISHSRLDEVKADHAEWGKMRILHSSADDLDIHGMANYGEVSWTGTDLSPDSYRGNTCCQRCKPKIDCNGRSSK